MANSIFRFYCNDCGKETNQTVLYECEKREIKSEDSSQDRLEESKVIQCNGCGFIGFNITSTYINERDEEGNVLIETETYPDSFDEEYEENDYRFLHDEEADFLPKMILNTYDEVSDAIAFDSNLLAGIGLRTIVEATCLDRRIPGRNLKEKIDNLHQQGFVSGNDLPILHKLREIGNLSVHQIKSPSKKTLDLALEIINHLLRSVYIIPKRGLKIK